MNLTERSFLVADAKLRDLMVTASKTVHTETWQGRDIASRPDAAMAELLNVTVSVGMRGLESLDHWRAECRPNLPWADDHFLERVSGEPLNPPPSWAWWPWAKSADKFRADQQFNHTYPERFWPKHAGGSVMVRQGIRWDYGDLNDVINLLRAQPLSRQAYLPIFFPEDTGIGDGGRKPCTLGYQFIMRENLLHCFYPMRSCDLVRHYRDDVYLAVRLMLHVLERLRFSLLASDQENRRVWENVRPGSLTMHMTSLHCFVNDRLVLKKERDDLIGGALS